MDTNQKQKKPIWQKPLFWLLMIFFVFPTIYAVLFLDEEEMAEKEKQEVEQKAQADSIKAQQRKERMDSLYRVATPEEKKIYDAQAKREAEYQAKKKQRALEAEERKSHKVINSPWDNSVLQVKNFLKENLNDPDSYESVKWYDAVYNKKKGTYSVRHKYRANNAFGAKILCDQVFYLTPDGTVIDSKDFGR